MSTINRHGEVRAANVTFGQTIDGYEECGHVIGVRPLGWFRVMVETSNPADSELEFLRWTRVPVTGPVPGPVPA